jgi:peptidoglycan L-alanyl-D-glutamate endopeptidase CwlK
MRDQISLSRVKMLHPAVVDEVEQIVDKIEAMFKQNMAIRITQGLRTFAEQDALYAQGRTTAGKKVTNAKGGESYHNYGISVDFALLHDKNNDGKFEEISWDMYTDWDEDHVNDWQEVVNAFVGAGWAWGGSWKTLKDYPHFEKTFGHNWRDLLVKYHNHDFIPNTNYVVL